jgi:hypothetical protein
MSIPWWIEIEQARKAYEFRLIAFSALAPKWSVTAPVPASWAKPVADWLTKLEHYSTSRATESQYLAFLERHIAALPGLLHDMDHDALAKVLEEGMAAAIVGGAEKSFSKLHTSSLILHPFSAAVSFGPLQEAVAKMDRKSPVAVALRSDQWDKVPVAIRERSQFSAKVASTRLLQHIQDQTRGALAWEKEKIAASSKAAGGEAFINRSSFIASARKIAVEEGINTTTPDKYGTVRDIRSAKRLGLIWDMQTTTAQEYARWKVNNDPEVLNAFPAQRLVRIEERLHPRPSWYWPSRWSEAFSAVRGEGAAEREMTALKTSPIWSKLSRFGTPWPPFDYQSGMGLEEIDRDEAESLGLVSPSDKISPDSDPGLNQGLEVGVKELDPQLTEWLSSQMGDAVSLVEGVLKWISK